MNAFSRSLSRAMRARHASVSAADVNEPSRNRRAASTMVRLVGFGTVDGRAHDDARGDRLRGVDVDDVLQVRGRCRRCERATAPAPRGVTAASSFHGAARSASTAPAAPRGGVSGPPDRGGSRRAAARVVKIVESHVANSSARLAVGRGVAVFSASRNNCSAASNGSGRPDSMLRDGAEGVNLSRIVHRLTKIVATLGPASADDRASKN